MYIRKHARPRDDRGRFLPDRQLWTRADGESRWVHWFQPDDSTPRRSLSFDDDAVRHLVVLCVVIAVAALLALVVR